MSLSNYEFQKNLGQGAFGTVIKVKNKKNGLIYALKKINLMKIDDYEIQGSLNEIRLLYSLNHPNIIGYKEAFYDKGSNTLNIVIEFAGDGDLLQKIKMNKKYHKRIDENTIWDWLIQLIIGIYYLHSAKCIHRDLKPANIFLKKNGLIKIGDLNVSKFLKNTLAETRTGTPLYMAPEVYDNFPYDYNADIWSLGCIIYELCSLEPPFKGENISELKKIIKAGRYIPIPNIYSNDLKKIIALMLQTNPNKRISSGDLLNLPIIRSKINKNNSKYQELLEKIQKPEIINTILPQQKDLPKLKVPKRTKSRHDSKNTSKSKPKKPPKSAKKKGVKNKLKDINIRNRASSSKRNNLGIFRPNQSKYTEQYTGITKEDFNISKYSEPMYENNNPSIYSKNSEENYNEYSERKLENKNNQFNNFNKVPFNYNNNIRQNYNEHNEINYDIRRNQHYNNNMNNQNNFYPFKNDNFGQMQRNNNYRNDNYYNNYNAI